MVSPFQPIEIFIINHNKTKKKKKLYLVMRRKLPRPLRRIFEKEE